MQLRISTLFGLIILISTGVLAQPKFNSPWSRIGLGELSTGYNSPIFLSGGLGAAFNDDYIPNFSNPASLAYLRATAFEVGLNGGYNILQSDNQTEQEVRGQLSHLSLAFPMRNPIGEILERKNTDLSWGMGIDLKTNSLVGYDIRVEDSTAALGNIQRIYQGDGGTYTFGWSNALRYKNFSAGLEVGVLFGNITATRALAFLDLQNPADDLFIDDLSLRGFKWNFGAMYRYLINKEEENAVNKRYLTIGVYGNANTPFRIDGTSFYRGIRQEVSIQDTVVNEQDLDHTGTYPAKYGFGLLYRLSENGRLDLTTS